MSLEHPVGADVMAQDTRSTHGRLTMRPAQILSQVDKPGTVPGYVVAFADGHRRYLTCDQVMRPPLEYAFDSHLHAVALRSRSRSATVSARLSRLLSKARAVGKHVYTAPGTTEELELLVRRRLLGQAAYQLAAAVETALDVTGDQRLDDHLDVFNEIGVDHQASAYNLSVEAGALSRHTDAIARIANHSPRIAAAMTNHLERNPS